MVCAICCIHMCSSLVNMVKSIAVIFVVLAMSQTHTLQTYGIRVEIEFSEDSNIAPPRKSPLHKSAGKRQQKIEFLQDKEAGEELFTYTQLLMNKRSVDGQPFQQDNLANQQSTASCDEAVFTCSIVNIGNYQGIRRDNGDLCILTNVPYCEGICPGIYRYIYYTVNYVFIHIAMLRCM